MWRRPSAVVIVGLSRGLRNCDIALDGIDFAINRPSARDQHPGFAILQAIRVSTIAWQWFQTNCHVTPPRSPEASPCSWAQPTSTYGTAVPMNSDNGDPISRSWASSRTAGSPVGIPGGVGRLVIGCQSVASFDGVLLVQIHHLTGGTHLPRSGTRHLGAVGDRSQVRVVHEGGQVDDRLIANVANLTLRRGRGDDRIAHFQGDRSLGRNPLRT